MIKKFLLLITFLILIDSCLAATIHGTVYDEGLDVITDVIVEVDSTPVQRQVAKDGTYSFTLPQGSYMLTVKYDGQATEEKITIEKDGDYVLDLFLFPSFEEEDELMTEAGDINIEDDYFKESDKTVFIITGVIIFLILIVIIFYFLKKKKPEIKVGIEDIIEDDEAKKYLDFIKKQGGRVTQKDIRKNFPMSEAKISLVITELEHKGKVEKIKKGRSNIIILKK